jgi:hypothetical protein
MVKLREVYMGFGVLLIVLTVGFSAPAQSLNEEEEFGPVVRGYLGYLRNEQNVVDDRASRHEVNGAYYRRNSNRIRALRQMAMKIARESHNDYLPELEAVAGDEFGLLFEYPPQSSTLRIGEVLQTTFKYLGSVRAGEMFFVFARLDPYEQSELMEKTGPRTDNASSSSSATPVTGVKAVTRSRRVTEPK